MQFSEYSDHPTTGSQQGPLVISTKVPHNFRPNNLSRDERVESTYSNGLGTKSRRPVNKKVELHLERIRRLEREIGQRSGPPTSGPSTSVDGEDEQEEEEEEVVRVETNLDDTDSSVVPRDDNSDSSGCVVAEFSVAGLSEEERSDQQSFSSDNDYNFNPNAYNGIGDSSTPDALRVGSSAGEKDTGVFSATTFQQEDISVSDVDEDSEVLSPDPRKDRMDNGERFKHLNTWHAQKDHSVQGKTEVKVESQSHKTSSLQCILEPDGCQGVKTSDTRSDNENNTAPVNGLPKEQVHIEIRIEDDEASASNTVLDYPGPLNVDNNRLKVEAFPSPQERRFKSKAKYGQAWVS